MTHERPCPPRPVFETLPKAVSLAIDHGNTHHSVNLARWGITYARTADQVRAEFERQIQQRSLQPASEEFDGK